MVIFHNDCKKKRDSYEVRFKEPYDFNNKFNKQYPYVYAYVTDHSLEGVSGYGSTKEEAIENYKIALRYLFDELKSIEKLYLDTDFIENNIVEADCFGNPLPENVDIPFIYNK